MALKLSLRPGERVAINGAVIVNGDRRASFVFETRANVLRERDIMQPDEANSPARRVYLPVMLMALEGRKRRALLSEFETRISEFAGVVTDRGALDLCLKIAARVANDDFYKALACCRELLEFEQTRLDHVA